VFGTRPEAIKMAPVVFALRDTPGFKVSTVVTGQHRAILDDVLSAFEIDPDVDLDLMAVDQTLSGLTARLFDALDPVLDRLHPDVVLAQGDTTTVMVTALVSFYRHLPFGHVEAGLRTYDKSRPFPEEINRVVAGRIADLHFAPTARAEQALLAEQVPAASIFVTGNTVIDALFHLVRRGEPLEIDIKPDSRLILLTAHRRESFGAPLLAALRAVREVVDANPDVEVLYPVHPNPQVVTAATAELSGHDRIHLVPPLRYPQFVAAMQRSYLILTDSGGVQEEAPALAKPVLVLRDETERPEAVDAGVVRLVGPNADRIVAETQRLLDDPRHYASMATGASPYGDGKAAARIVEALRDWH
jgi:UDP-N-acetylglucosamine 2-epimerase (non-hydrolysing)